MDRSKSPTGVHAVVGGVKSSTDPATASARVRSAERRRRDHLRGREEYVGASAARFQRERRRSFRESRVTGKVRERFADYEDRLGVANMARKGVARFRDEIPPS